MIGRTTEDQMHIGIYWGYVAMMEGLVARMKAEIGRPAKVVATGGLATLFDEHTDHFRRDRADLTIQGWRCCAEPCLVIRERATPCEAASRDGRTYA